MGFAALHVTSSSQCGFLNSLLDKPVKGYVPTKHFWGRIVLAYVLAQGKERALPCILRRVPDGLLSSLLLDVLVSSTKAPQPPYFR